MTPIIELGGDISVYESEIRWQAVRAQGAGGQHVNKTSSAVVLRFDIGASTLPDALKARLLALSDRRINSDGIVVIKSQDGRSQLSNRRAAVARLRDMIAAANTRRRPRIPTKPKASTVRRQLEKKRHRGATKQLRSKPRNHGDE